MSGTFSPPAQAKPGLKAQQAWGPVPLMAGAGGWGRCCLASILGWEAKKRPFSQSLPTGPSPHHYPSALREHPSEIFKPAGMTSCYNLPVSTTFPETKIRRTILGLIIL